MKAPLASELRSLGHLQNMKYGSYLHFTKNKLALQKQFIKKRAACAEVLQKQDIYS